jgi:hypothetical protein
VSDFEKNPDEMGALWVKEGKHGQYMTGVINDVRVVAFPAKKTSEKSPDWRVLKSKPREDAPPQRQAPPERVDLTEDDVPF